MLERSPGEDGRGLCRGTRGHAGAKPKPLGVRLAPFAKICEPRWHRFFTRIRKIGMLALAPRLLPHVCPCSSTSLTMS